MTATVDQVSLIAASIMSKKIAAGARRDRARREGRRRRLHEDARRRARARARDARARGAGRARGRLRADRHGPAARRARSATRSRCARRSRRCAARARRTSPSSCSTSAAHLLALSDLGVDDDEGRRRAEAAVADGSAVEAYERWIAAQGGDPDEAALPAAAVVREVTAPRAGYVRELGAIRVGIAALHLGAGRQAKERRDRPRGRRRLPREARRPGRGGRACSRRFTRATTARPRRRRPRWSRPTSSATSRAAAAARSCSTDGAIAVPCRSYPRSRRSARRSSRCSTGRRLERAELFDYRLTLPEPTRGGGAGARGRAHRRGRPARQVPAAPLRERARAPDPPADDGIAAPAPGGSTTTPTARAARARRRHRVAYRDIRRFGTWLLARGRTSSRTSPRGSASEPFDAALHAAARARSRAGARRVKAALLDQRTVAGLGNIYADEALWRAQIHPLRPAGSLDPAELRRLHARDPRGAARRDRAPGRDAARLPRARRQPRADAARVQGLRPRRASRATAAARRSTKTRVAGRGTWYCPTLPAAARRRRYAAASCVELARRVEPPELGVAADRLAVDQDLRHRPAAGQVEQLARKSGSRPASTSSYVEPLPSSSALARTQ